MRRILILLALLGCAGPAFAAEDEPDFAPAADAHAAGRWSFQFELGPDFQLSNFDGAGIAVTRNTSDRSAWRLGTTLSFDHGDQDVDQLNFQSQPSYTRNSQFLAVDVDLLRLKRFRPTRRVDFELGLGPQVSYDHSKADIAFTDDNFVWKVGATTGFLGLAARLGAEFMVARSVGVHAHYGWRAGYERSRQTSDYTHVIEGVGTIRSEGEAVLDRWLVSQEGVLLGVSVYL
jgi:hypothetical protein